MARSRGERTLWLTAGGLFAAGTILISCFNALTFLAGQDETTTHSYEQAVSQLEIDADNGDVRVETSSDGKIHVQRHVEWSYHKPEIIERFTGQALELGVDCGFWAVTRCSVDYVVEIPPETDLDLDTGSGNLDVRDVVADVRASTGSGDIDLVNVGHESTVVDAHTGSGDVNAHNIKGTMTLRSGSGDINGVQLAASHVGLRTGSGDINFRFTLPPQDLVTKTGSGDVHIAVPNESEYLVSVDTGSGDEDVNVDESAQATHSITATTGSGDISIVYLD